MSAFLISVVVPAYNVEKYLDRCMQSLVNQTLRDIEIVLVDDKSSDKTPEMCDSWAKKDSRIKVIHNLVNEGLGMACNSGLEVAAGKYVAFCDSDDWVDADMYKIMYETAEKENAQMVLTGLKRVDEVGHVSPMNHIMEKRIYKGRSHVESLMLDLIASEPSDPIERHIQMSAKVVLYSREHLAKNNIRFESERKIISEDLFFNLDNLTRAECVIVLPEIFYNYYCNNQSLTSKVRTDRFEKNLEMRTALLNRYLFREMPEEFVTRVNRMFIGYSRTDIRQICRTKSLQATEKKQWLKDVCRHPIWTELNSSYPVQKMPILHRLFFKCIYRSNLCMLKLMSNIGKILNMKSLMKIIYLGGKNFLHDSMAC